MTDEAYEDKIADMIAFGASENALYLYPGTDHQPTRAAYCDGAADGARALLRWQSERTAALATQPATSQEGASPVGYTNPALLARAKSNPLDTGCASVELYRYPAGDYCLPLFAATPTPPTLSVDLREAAGECVSVMDAADAVPVSKWKVAVSCGNMRDRFPCARCGADAPRGCKSGLTIAEIDATRDFINGYGWPAALARAQGQAS
jgi:hypothetical protein